MDEAAKQGWNVFFWAMDTAGHFDREGHPLPRHFLRQPMAVRPGHGDVRIAHDLRLLAGQAVFRHRASALAKVSPTLSAPRLPQSGPAPILCRSVRLGARRWSAIGETPVYTIVVSCTVIFLFFSFAIPITAGLTAYGTHKWPRIGPWSLGKPAFTLMAILSIVAMILIFVLGIQPPNQFALYITVGFFVLAAVIWYAFEQRRFKGPPIGEEIARRQAAILAAETAVGETG